MGILRDPFGRSGLVLPGRGGAGLEVSSAMSAVGTPYWADWELNITYTGGTTQQLAWFQEALNECTYPLEALAVKINVIWGALPTNSDTRHPYMVTEMNTPNEATIFIASWADDPTNINVSGLPNAQADIKEFYKESVIHELGHVATYGTIDSPNRTNRAANIAAACALFRRTDTGRQGVSSDWDDPSLAWADEIREGIAEAFKCSFYANRSKLIYHNRSHWTIRRGDWPGLLKLWQLGKFDFMDTDNVSGTGQVFTEWFMGGSVFISDNGTITPVDWTWMPGGVARTHFLSTDPGVPPPPPPPPGTLGHGWTGDSTDMAQKWASGSIDGMRTMPPLTFPNNTMSRKGKVELWVNEMAMSQCSAGVELLDSTGRAVADVSYNWSFTPTGFATATAYGVSVGSSHRGSSDLPGGRGVPLLPPALLVIEFDADAGTITAGVASGSGDPVPWVDSISVALVETGDPLYYPFAQFSWDMLGDDPGFPPDPINPYSVLSAGPATWTTYPTPVSGPYPYPPRAVVPVGARAGLLSMA